MKDSDKRPLVDVNPDNPGENGKGRVFNPFDVKPTARRRMIIYFILDVSGSMYGQKISALNEVMKDCVQFIAEFSASNPDAEIYVNVLFFANGAWWMYPAPVPADQFQWKDVDASGGTDLAAGCRELSQHLHRSADMGDPAGCYVPGIILMSDGHPNGGWEGEFDESAQNDSVLMNNKWFRAALKRAVAIGNDADIEPLARFTGSRERVITVHNVDALKEVLRLTAKGLSTIGSTSTLTGSGTKDDQLTEELRNGVDGVDGASLASDPVTHIEDEWD